MLLIWAPLALARQWYEHYERGLAAAEAGRWGEALTELEEAAKLEPKAKARARTYGRQFLTGYDPAYQRSRCLVELGRFQEAEALLAEARAAGVTAAAQLAALEERLLQAHRALSAEPPPVSPTPSPAVVPPPEPTGERAPQVSTDSPESNAKAAPEEAAEAPKVPPKEVPPVSGATRQAPPEPPARQVPATSPEVPPDSPQGAPADSGKAGEERPSPAVSTTSEPSWARAWLLAALALAVLAFLVGRLRRPSSPPAVSTTSGAWHLQRLGSRLGDYQLDGELGRGGMATTFRARRRDGRTVALKVPHPSGDPTYQERFLREGRLGEALHHPGIVRIFEAGEAAGVPFLAMELIAGRTLKAELAEHPQGLPPRRALEVARAIAEALDYAHGKGVVHRDLKPENVMLTPEGGVKVMDFGVARLADQPGLTTSELFLGSPLYAAPEAVEPSRITPRSDLYSLGILLFEMATGQLPFVHESVYKLLELHQRQPLPEPHSLPRPVTLSEPLWRLIERLCAKDPKDRYPSAQALLVELSQQLDNGSFAS